MKTKTKNAATSPNKPGKAKKEESPMSKKVNHADKESLEKTPEPPQIMHPLSPEERDRKKDERE
jgi:hypothetical protein